jgi:hypothetical protein
MLNDKDKRQRNQERKKRPASAETSIDLVQNDKHHHDKQDDITAAMAPAENDKENSTQKKPRAKRRRRRRSLFAVLFNQNKSHNDRRGRHSSDSSSSSSSDCDELKPRNESRRRRNDSDIVLIMPNEAKCIEATVASLVNDTDEKRPAGVGASSAEHVDAASQPKRRQNLVAPDGRSTSSSFFARRIRRFRKKKSRDEDADSYVIDLNDCLDREKLRASSSSLSSLSFSSISSFSSLASNEERRPDDVKNKPKQTTKITSAAKSLLKRNSSRKKPNADTAREPDDTKECSPLRETSPIDDLWQTNKEYIPAKETNNNNQDTESLSQQQQQQQRQQRQQQQRKQASPTLVEFLQSHQIHLDVVDSLAPASQAAGRTLTTPTSGIHSSSSSSQDSLSWSNERCGAAKRPELRSDRRAVLPTTTTYHDQLLSSRPLTPAKLNELSESDRRLYHWRKLAARSVSMWQVPEDSSSDEDDSNSAELVDCNGPATVCYCSDDTSCSSVELVWSPRPAAKPAGAPNVTLADLHELERQRQLLLARPLHLLVTPSSSDHNLSSSGASVSPGGYRLSTPNAANVRLSSKSPTPPAPRSQLPAGARPGQLQVCNLPRKRVTDCTNSSNSNNNSFRSSASSQTASSIICQKPSILELAKPSRARDRRIGRNDPERYRRVGLRSKHRVGDKPTPSADEPNGATRAPAGEIDRDEHGPTTVRCVDSPARRYERATSVGRDWSAVPTSRPASVSDWHPNPLFGRLRTSPVASQPNEDLGAKNGPSRKSCPAPIEQQQDHNESGGKPTRPNVGPNNLLRRHSSVAGDLDQQRHLVNDGDKHPAGSKSNRFMSFLAKIKSRHEHLSTTTSSEADQYECDSVRLNNSDTISMNGFGLNNGRAKRHRWSLRMKSPFSANNNNSASTVGTNSISSDRAYLSQVSANLDKLKNQLSERLSDTGKRASILADQLITSIKDTTKEQLLMATTGANTDQDQYDTLPNSFAVSTPDDPLVVHRQLKQDGSGTNDRRAKLFSLIYMHQQHQADGRPVITKQPTSSNRCQQDTSVISSSVDDSHHRMTTDNRRAHHQPRPQSISICQQDCRTTGADEIDLDKLLDPKELLMDRFRALNVRANREMDTSRRRTSNVEERMTRTIATRASDGLIKRRTNKGTTTSNNDHQTSSKRRRSSCTV